MRCQACGRFMTAAAVSDLEAASHEMYAGVPSRPVSLPPPRRRAVLLLECRPCIDARYERRGREGLAQAWAEAEARCGREVAS